MKILMMKTYMNGYKLYHTIGYRFNKFTTDFFDLFFTFFGYIIDNKKISVHFQKKRESNAFSFLSRFQ